MKINQTQGQALLELVTADQQISKTRNQIRAVASGEAQNELRASYTALASELLLVRNQFEANEAELKRAEADLATVELRIAKDQERLNQSSSAKDIQGIESELATLAKRKSDLEDAELAILETQEDLQGQLDEVSMRHQGAAQALNSAEESAESELQSLQASLTELVNQRERVFAQLGTELAELYERRAAKGVAAGRLIGRECGACRMQLGAVDFEHISVTAADELASCPECQAMLVRNV